MLKNDFGNSLTDQVSIEVVIVDYFTSFFKTNEVNIHEQIISIEHYDYAKTPSMHEVQEVVYSIGGGEAPIFFHHFWKDIKKYCYKMVKTIFETKIMPANLNSTLISLIPKIKNPMRIKNLRPIILVNTTYKLVTKILIQ